MKREINFFTSNSENLDIKSQILFNFDLNSKLLKKQEEQYKIVYTISSLTEFYSVLKNDSEIFNENRTFTFTANSDVDSDAAIKSYQLLSFYIFYLKSKKRLNEKMKNFNNEICIQSDTHISKNMSEFARVNNKGKYIRGSLVNLGFYILQQTSIEYSDELALAFEIFQTSILVHDDIIDHASLRRGQPTIPAQYIDDWYSKGLKNTKTLQDVANSLAICSGDIGMYFANQKLTESYYNFNNFAKLLKYFNQIVIKTIQGEIIDIVLRFEEQQFCLMREEDLENSITEIYRLKTAWYTIIGPLCLGAILAGAKDDEIEILEIFAENLGIAFQIKDDILGIFASENELGKNVGSDITEFKQTLLYSHVRKSEEYYSELLKYYGKQELLVEDLKAVQRIFKESGALSYAKNRMNMYLEYAIKNLSEIKFISDSGKTLLFGLIWYLKLREK